MVDSRQRSPSRLRAERWKVGLPAEKLAVMAGISRGTLLLAERAPHLASQRTLTAIARVLGVDPAELREAQP
jgi:transcriptional regulator with XRE-family HTH domain